MKNIKSNKAITLIALVITIVVLIILATVVINLSLSNNGILNRAKTATEQYQNAESQERMDIAKAANEIDSYVDGNRDYKTEIDTLKEQVSNLQNQINRKGSTVLWEGLANTQNSPYYFKESTMDVSNYDYILIEFVETSKYARDANLISKQSIKKNDSSEYIRISGYATRYTDMYFIDNGFTIAGISGDAKLYPSRIIGINI